MSHGQPTSFAICECSGTAAQVINPEPEPTTLYTTMTEMNNRSSNTVCDPNSLAEQIRQLIRDRLAAGVSKKFVATTAYPLQATAMEHIHAFLGGQKTISVTVADRIIEALGFEVRITSGESDDRDPNPEF